MTDDFGVRWQDLITIEQSERGARAVVNGTTMTADGLLRELASGRSIREPRDVHPELGEEALRAVFALTAAAVERKYPPKLPDDFWEGPEWTELPR